MPTHPIWIRRKNVEDIRKNEQTSLGWAVLESIVFIRKTKRTIKKNTIILQCVSSSVGRLPHDAYTNPNIAHPTDQAQLDDVTGDLQL